MGPMDQHTPSYTHTHTRTHKHAHRHTHKHRQCRPHGRVQHSVVCLLPLKIPGKCQTQMPRPIGVALLKVFTHLHIYPHHSSRHMLVAFSLKREILTAIFVIPTVIFNSTNMLEQYRTFILRNTNILQHSITFLAHQHSNLQK